MIYHLYCLLSVCFVYYISIYEWYIIYIVYYLSVLSIIYLYINDISSVLFIICLFCLLYIYIWMIYHLYCLLSVCFVYYISIYEWYIIYIVYYRSVLSIIYLYMNDISSILFIIGLFCLLYIYILMIYHLYCLLSVCFVWTHVSTLPWEWLMEFFCGIVSSPASRDSSCRRIKRVASQWKSKTASVCTSVTWHIRTWSDVALMFLCLSAVYSAYSLLTGSAWRRRWRAAVFRPAGWAYVQLIAPEPRWQTGRPKSQFVGFTKYVCSWIEAHHPTNDIRFLSRDQGNLLALSFYGKAQD